MSFGQIGILVIAVLIAATAFEYWLKRGKTRPLADRFDDSGIDAPKQPLELGTEAIDHAAFNRSARLINARVNMNGAGGHGNGLWMEAYLKPPLPPINDETNVTRTEREAMQKEQKS